jgi:hypothetical protein
MRSNPSNDTGPDVDLGLFEDVLLAPVVTSTAPPPPPKPAAKATADRAALPPVVSSETSAFAAGVQFLTLDRGLYTVTISGYANDVPEFQPSPLPAVDIVLLPGQTTDAATVVSPFTAAPPWPYGRDVALIVKVSADQARFGVITYRLEEATASPLLRIERLP